MSEVSQSLVPVQHKPPASLTKAVVGPQHLTPTHAQVAAGQARAGAGAGGWEAGGFGPYVERGDMERLLSMVPAESPLGMLLRFLWQSGARISEALAVKVRDVNFARATVNVVTLKRGKDKRTGRPRPPEFRDVPIQPDLVGLFGRHVAYLRLSPEARFWPWGRRHASGLIAEGMRAAGIPAEQCHPHAIRHGHAIAAIKAGVALPILQKQLGHASIATTAIYLQFTLRDRVEAYRGVF